MNPEKIDINEATEQFRILGLTFTATKKEVRRARNKLLSHFHPDKYPYGWVVDSTLPADRVNLIQNAYMYIMDHYQEIQRAFELMPQMSLSNRMPLKTKSHWAYTTIETFRDDLL